MSLETEKMKLMVAGGAGFIGSNFIRYWLDKYPKDEVCNFDNLTYAGSIDSLKDVEKACGGRYFFVKGDITDPARVNETIKQFRPDIVVNFAAESHNSWAVINPTIFFKTNIMGTQTLLEACRQNKVSRFHHISTCEVYGDLPLDSDESFSETSPLRPRTPYNASKAGSDLAVRAYFETYHLPVTTTNCSNNYGPFQFPEKLIPLFVTNLMDGKQVPVYTSSQNKREWLHVLDHCKAIDLVIRKGKIGETYNVGSGIEKSVEEITDIILKELGQPNSMKKYVQDRPGHDRRYLLDSSKIKHECGWHPEIVFEDGIRQTIRWYQENRDWWEPFKKKQQIIEEGWK